MPTRDELARNGIGGAGRDCRRKGNLGLGLGFTLQVSAASRPYGPSRVTPAVNACCAKSNCFIEIFSMGVAYVRLE